MKQTKTYALEAKILTEDPQAIFAYPKQNIVLFESEVIRLKKLAEQNRMVTKTVAKLLNFLDLHSEAIYSQKPIRLNNEASLFVLNNPNTHPNISSPTQALRQPNALLDSILHHPTNMNLELKTNDAFLRVQAALFGIKASPHVPLVEPLEPFQRLFNVSLGLQDAQALLQNQQIICPNHVSRQLAPNQHAVFEVQGKQYLCRYKPAQLLLVSTFQEGVWNLKPSNPEQQTALDLLLDPAVKLVILSGKAGTGKTLLALAAGLEQLLEKAYAKVLVSRPIIPMGRDMGYLPGNVEEKMMPWMQPIFDNLDFLQSLDKNSKTNSSQKLLDRRLVELEALTYIRGRSIARRFMIIDEAQNLTQHEVKTLLTRVGNHSKIVLTGDPYQIDSEDLNTQNNGLTHVVQKMKHSQLAGHAHLVRSERSELAELAADIL